MHHHDRQLLHLLYCTYKKPIPPRAAQVVDTTPPALTVSSWRLLFRRLPCAFSHFTHVGSTLWFPAGGVIALASRRLKLHRDEVAMMLYVNPGSSWTLHSASPPVCLWHTSHIHALPSTSMSLRHRLFANLVRQSGAFPAAWLSWMTALLGAASVCCSLPTFPPPKPPPRHRSTTWGQKR